MGSALIFIFSPMISNRIEKHNLRVCVLKLNVLCTKPSLILTALLLTYDALLYAKLIGSVLKS